MSKEINREIRCVFILCPRRLDAIFHNCDLFENFKRLIAEPLILTITLKKGVRIKTSFPKWTKAFDQSEEHELIAAFIPYTSYCWTAPGVVTVSTGTGWCLLQDMIKHMAGPELELRKTP